MTIAFPLFPSRVRSHRASRVRVSSGRRKILLISAAVAAILGARPEGPHAAAGYAAPHGGAQPRIVTQRIFPMASLDPAYAIRAPRAISKTALLRDWSIHVAQASSQTFDHALRSARALFAELRAVSNVERTASRNTVATGTPISFFIDSATTVWQSGDAASLTQADHDELRFRARAGTSRLGISQLADLELRILVQVGQLPPGEYELHAAIISAVENDDTRMFVRDRVQNRFMPISTWGIIERDAMIASDGTIEVLLRCRSATFAERATTPFAIDAIKIEVRPFRF
ncbi:MAG: hypothetical protein ACR2GY_07465 [Phycisphaerales bacterium]